MTSNITVFHHPGGCESFPAGSPVELTLMTERSLTPSIRDVGAGRVVLKFEDPQADNIAEDDVLQFFIDGEIAGAMIAERYEEVVVDDGEEADQVWIWEGPTTLGVFNRGLINPPGGAGRSPWTDDVTFNYTHPDHDSSGWTNATTVCTVEYAQLNASNVPATPDVDGRWGYLQVWAPDFPQHALSGVGSGTTEILWAFDGTTDGLTTGVGTCYFVSEVGSFICPYDGDYWLFFACDNTGQVHIDGKPIIGAGTAVPGSIANPSTSGFSTTTKAKVNLSAGEHKIAFAIDNSPPPGAPNPGGFSAAVYIPGYPPTLIWESTSSTVVVEPYAAEPPGMTATHVLRVVIEAEQALGFLSYIDCSSFSDTQDSDGNNMPLLNIATRVGVPLDQFIVELMQTYIDVILPGDGWQPLVYLKASVQPASGVTFTEGVNTTLKRRRGIGRQATDLLSRWQGGHSDSGTGGEFHKYVQLGPQTVGAEVGRLVTGLLGVHANPRQMPTVAFWPQDASEVPYVNPDFRHGCLATADSLLLVIAITMSQSSNAEPAAFALTLNDHIADAQERLVIASTR